MSLKRTSLLFRALGNLLLGRREAADQQFSAMLLLCPGDAYALAGRAHLRAESCRRAEALAEAQWLAAHEWERVSPEHTAEPAERGRGEPALRFRGAVGQPQHRETGLVR